MGIKPKVKKLLRKIKIEVDNILFYSIVIGILLLSAGVYLMGSGINRSIGRDMIIVGSGVFYVSVIIFTFRLK
jgi:hypothetical protein